MTRLWLLIEKGQKMLIVIADMLFETLHRVDFVDTQILQRLKRLIAEIQPEETLRNRGWNHGVKRLINRQLIKSDSHKDAIDEKRQFSTKTVEEASNFDCFALDKLATIVL